MGQRADSGRHASLDDKKERASGRQQNDPARKAITDREQPPQVPGASGGGQDANRSTKQGTFAVTGDQSGASGGEAAMDVEQRLAKDAKSKG
jgi:hypothetical protein